MEGQGSFRLVIGKSVTGSVAITIIVDGDRIRINGHVPIALAQFIIQFFRKNTRRSSRTALQIKRGDPRAVLTTDAIGAGDILQCRRIHIHANLVARLPLELIVDECSFGAAGVGFQAYGEGRHVGSAHRLLFRHLGLYFGRLYVFGATPAQTGGQGQVE